MEENYRNEEVYLIPKNIKARFEILPGFGWRELAVSGLCTIIGFGIAGILYLFNVPIIIELVVILLFGGSGYLMSVQNPRTGLSMLSMIKHMRKFKKKQNQYFYVYRGR